MIRPVRAEDAAAICAIYNHYIANTIISFEEDVLDVAAMERRIADITAAYPWFVAEEAGRIVGYSYAGVWRTRMAYRYTVESTIYLAPDATGKGYGTALYGALLEALTAAGFRAVLGGIALPNAASVALHEKCGFVKVGHLPKVGFKLGRWIDVGYWQRELGTGTD